MLYIGNLVNTQGLKGEVKIISSFKYKNLVFQKNNHLYIKDEVLTITHSRVHKNFDIVSFKEYDNIDDVLKLKGEKVYINREEYHFPGPLNEDLYGKKVYDNHKEIGILKDIVKNEFQELLVVQIKEKTYLVPYVPEFVENIDETGIYLKLIKGLIDENWYINNISRNVYRFSKYFNN